MVYLGYHFASKPSTLGKEVKDNEGMLTVVKEEYDDYRVVFHSGC